MPEVVETREPIQELESLLKRRRPLSQRVSADQVLAAVHDYLAAPTAENRACLDDAVAAYADVAPQK